MATNISTVIASAQLARLIPTVVDSKKEERATSCVLATFMIIPKFVREILSEVGAPIGKRAKLECYTEVLFDKKDKSKIPRPDGLIVIKSGNNTWTALVESKIGSNLLTNEQVEEYLDLAKSFGIDALITISNQFASTPNTILLKSLK